MIKNEQLKNKVKKLRESGLTYSEINKRMGGKISKSSISFWCRNIKLNNAQKFRIKLLSENNLQNARLKAQLAARHKRQCRLDNFRIDNVKIANLLEDKQISKLVVSCLYLAEGGKKRSGSLCFGNSDPGIIKLFLYTLRKTYNVDELKFRCTLQCRADQDVKKLEAFWQKTTNINFKQFYHAQIDKRSIGKTTKKKDYKGVCRIDYLDGKVFDEIMVIGKVICLEC